MFNRMARIGQLIGYYGRRAQIIQFAALPVIAGFLLTATTRGTGTQDPFSRLSVTLAGPHAFSAIIPLALWMALPFTFVLWVLPIIAPTAIMDRFVRLRMGSYTNMWIAKILVGGIFSLTYALLAEGGAAAAYMVSGQARGMTGVGSGAFAIMSLGMALMTAYILLLLLGSSIHHPTHQVLIFFVFLYGSGVILNTHPSITPWVVPIIGWRELPQPLRGTNIIVIMMELAVAVMAGWWGEYQMDH